MIARLIGRLLVVPFGLGGAGLAGLATLVTLGQERLVHVMRGAGTDTAVFGVLEIVMKVGLLVLSPQTLLLPLLIAIAGEVAHIRSALYYVAAFGALGAAVPLLGRVSEQAAGGVPLVPLFATAGFAAGAAYWLIAGRSA